MSCFISMKIGIIRYPGGHGDAELKFVLENEFRVHVHEIWYKDEVLFDGDIIFVAGGFPCKFNAADFNCLDDSPAILNLKSFSALGKRIVGLGNGFHLLCEAGLLPGRLIRNSSNSFICKHVYLKPEDFSSGITDNLNKEEAYRLPIATYIGQYAADEEELVQMRQKGQILYRFCDHDGRITEAINYTGSIDNIAGVCNFERNVFGLISLPERAVFDPFGDGRRVLEGMLSF